MTYYILDASGNQMAMYHRPEQSSNLILQDQQIYGSSREAVLNRNLVLNTATLPTTHYSHRLGDKQFQISNLPIAIGMGNVLSTFSDHLKKDNGGSGSTVLAYKPIILSVSTYSSFGAPLEDGSTNWSNESYRYGFNGMEKDDEMKGAGNSYDFGARIYDARLGRWMSLDPKFKEDPGFSPYCFAYNSPLLFEDPDGRKPKVTILPQSFAHNVGKPITNIHQLGQTDWQAKLKKDKNGKVTGIEINVFSVLNYAFVEGPFASVNPNAKLNKDNPGLYLCVSNHEAIHARHLKAILEDDSQIYVFGKHKGNINDIYASFYNDLEAEKEAALKKIANTKYKTEAERKAAEEKANKNFQEKANEFEYSMRKQVKDKMNEKYKNVGGEEKATIQENSEELKKSGQYNAFNFQNGEAVKVNGTLIK